MNKKLFGILVVAVILLGAGWVNSSVKNTTHISTPTPPIVPGSGNQTGTDATPVKADITVTVPTPGQEVTSPLAVEGRVKGMWYFEAQFPIRIVDANERQLGVGTAYIVGERTVESTIPFTATITFSTPTTATGTLIMIRDNPSGLPENDASFRVPVAFAKHAATTSVKVFFGNEQLNLDPTFNCKEMHPVTREVAATKTIGRSAIEALLKGPTVAERQSGYRTSISEGVILNSLTIVNGLATADFNEQLEYRVGGSCMTDSIRQQIIDTLKQFPTVKIVTISINGKSEYILQP